MNTLIQQNELQKKQERSSRLISNFILVIALALIGVLAIPAGISIGLICMVWSSADYLIRKIEKTA